MLHWGKHVWVRNRSNMRSFLVGKERIKKQVGFYSYCHSSPCICMAESLCCLPETIITFLISSTPLQNKKLKQNKNRSRGFPDCKESALQCKGHGFNPWSWRIPHALKQLRPCATTTSLHTTTTKDRVPRTCAPQQEKLPQ